MVFFLSLFLLPSSMAGEPWCEGPWLRTSVDSRDLESSTRACVSHWLGLIYGEGWTEYDLIYDPISSIRAPDTLSVPELQEAQRFPIDRRGQCNGLRRYLRFHRVLWPKRRRRCGDAFVVERERGAAVR